MKNYYKSFITILAFFIGCSSDTPKETESVVLPIYNEAYQENFEADSINSILENAKDAYVLIDPFEGDVAKSIEKIKQNNNQVAGYISAGTGEIDRDDFSDLEPFLSTKAWEDWPDEFFVSQTNTGIVEVMKKRIDKMSNWGLDWIEFDNMDWLEDDSNKVNYNLQATKEEAISYINSLCTYAKTKNIKCMAKNTVNGFDNFDGVLYESFSNNKNWWDKEGTKKFLKDGKLVIINHYNEAHCDDVYREYKRFYKSENISFICEDVLSKRYKHYH